MPISVADLVAPGATPAPAAPPVAAPVAAAPAAAPAPGTLQEPLVPNDDSKAKIPDAVLQIPAFRALLEGSPPAVLAKGGDADPDLETLKANVEPLLYSGFGFYQAKDGITQVIYNSQFMDGNTLKIADEKGRLDTVAAPFGDLRSHFDQALGAPEGGAVAPEAPAPAPVASTTPPAPAAQAKLSTARLMSAAPGAPTSGPVPGQGRVLSQILKPTV